MKRKMGEKNGGFFFFLIPYPNHQKNRLVIEIFERKKRKNNQYQFQSNTDILKLGNISQKCILYKNDQKKCPHKDFRHLARVFQRVFVSYGGPGGMLPWKITEI